MGKGDGGPQLERTDPSQAGPETVVSTLGAALAGARPGDPVGMVIARARVAAALFESSKGSGVGRFELLDRLGAGGMGVIYAAYDPQLERAVAVKLVYLPVPDGGRALAEAKALARLAHPNVVTIFDYGFADDHLYIVMELVLGQTLKRWAKGRPQQEIVEAYTQAGKGLAAAHAAALIHRDFKPENAIMGADGRVRVVDFGLACEVADPSLPGPVSQGAAGTPGYMAPEQMLGGPITAAADQYGLCTALREALDQNRADGRGSVIPRWLLAAIDRGRATNPADRFPSMVDLLHALSRDPVAIRRRRMALGAVVGLGALLLTGGRATLKSREDPCKGAEARLTTIWGEGGADAALARIAQISPYGASLRPKLQRELANHARRWTVSYRDACGAGARGVQSRELTDRRMACLERGRSALKSVAQIVETTDAHNVADLALAINALPEPEACDDLTALLSDAERPPREVAVRVVELRSRLDEARVQIAAGRSQKARPITDAIVRAAREVSYEPLLSEALLVQGNAMMNTDERVASIAPFTESFTLAFRAGLFSIAVEAWARRAWSRGTSLGGEQSLSGLEVVEAVAAYRSTSGFSRALLYNNVGGVEMALERREQARVAFERAADEARRVTGPGTAELLTINVNLGWVIDDPSRRDAVLAQAVANRIRVLGDEHPQTLDASWLRGLATVRYDDALAVLEPTCVGLEAHGGLPAQRCWFEVGFLRGELDDPARAVSALERGKAMATDPEFTLPLVAPYLEFWRGNLPAATREFASAIAALPSNQDEPWWDRFDRAELELGLARTLRLSGRRQEAKKVLVVSLKRWEAIASKKVTPAVDRRFSRARAELAEVLQTLHEPRSSVSGPANLAAAWLRQAGGSEREIAALERLSAPRRQTHAGQGQEIVGDGDLLQ